MGKLTIRPRFKVNLSLNLTRYNFKIVKTKKIVKFNDKLKLIGFIVTMSPRSRPTACGWFVPVQMYLIVHSSAYSKKINILIA